MRFTKLLGLVLFSLPAFGQKINLPSSGTVSTDWLQSPSAELSSAGAKTITLTPCPRGVDTTSGRYYVLIAGTGTPEARPVTGGTCTSAAASGTITLRTLNAHSAGYTLGSASQGIQEMSNYARFTPTSPLANLQSGRIVIPPGEYKAHARISIRASNQMLDFSGSIVECNMDDSCIFVGDPSNSLLFENITIINPRGRPMVANGTKPFIEVNAQKTRVFNVATRSPAAGNSFGSYVQVDDDQAFLLDGLDTNLGYGVRCDATFCGSYVTAPGPFNTWSAVGWLKNMNISPQCQGNGVDWQSGNTLRISDSVIQGAAQFHVRTGAARGGFGPSEFDNVYIESGTCTNPAGAIGQAGIIAQGQKIRWMNGEGPQGKVPQFANTGTKEYRYYIVPHHATYGYGNPLYAGKALTNGSGNVTVTTPDIAGVDTFDLLRTTWTGNGSLFQAPYGTGNWAVVTSVTRGSACVSGVCTFTDTQAALSSYTVAATTYYPLLSFWAGAFVLGSPSDTNSSLSGAVLTTDILSQQVVSVSGEKQISVFANACTSLGFWTPMMVSCAGGATSPESFYEQGALLMHVKPNADGGQKTNLKGRLNFPTLGTGPGHIITLSDSNFQKTVATGNNRPTNDANDAFIGYDVADGNPAHVGISFGAPVSLCNYIANVGDGTNWKECLSSAVKTFKIPISTNSQITSTLATGTAPLVIASTTTVPNLTASNHPKVQDCGVTIRCSATTLTTAQIVRGTVALSGGAARVTGISPAFTSRSTFNCTASDTTSASSPSNAVPVSASSIRVAGTGNDIISYICVGN